jgi:hypothetical protein
VVILQLIHASNPDLRRDVLIRFKPARATGFMVIHDNFSNRMALR